LKKCPGLQLVLLISYPFASSLLIRWATGSMTKAILATDSRFGFELH